MAIENQEQDPDDLSPEEAREHLVRLIARHELERNEAIYRKLERE